MAPDPDKSRGPPQSASSAPSSGASLRSIFDGEMSGAAARRIDAPSPGREMVLTRRSPAASPRGLLSVPADELGLHSDNDDIEKSLHGNNFPTPSTSANTSAHSSAELSVPLLHSHSSAAGELPLPASLPPSATHLRAQSVRLAVAVVGIYASYLCYGSLQEDVFNYTSPPVTSSGSDGSGGGEKFRQVWFLQSAEALASVCVGLMGGGLGSLLLYDSGGGAAGAGGSVIPPYRHYFTSGATQLLSKFLTASALASGLSFPVATLAKCGKMAPVMAGQYVYGGARYDRREYVQVGMIVGGTALLSLGKQKSGTAGSSNSSLGLILILMSLVMDGVTAGLQKRLKMVVARRAAAKASESEPLVSGTPSKSPGTRSSPQQWLSGGGGSAQHGSSRAPKPFEFMLYTNLSMLLLSSVASLLLGETSAALARLSGDPALRALVVKFCACSAIGQLFIFYAVAHFDPLVCSTVTTTRKIASVLISIAAKGHRLSGRGWCGIAVAVAGIAGEVHGRVRGASRGGRLKSKVSM